MVQANPFVLAVGGVMLVAWYGISRLSSHREARRFPRVLPGSDDYQRIARAAHAAEFHQIPSPPHDHLPGGVVHCPCGLETHPAGVLFCSCGRANRDEPPDTLDAQQPAVGEEWVCVYVAENSWKAGLIRRLLEERLIPSTCTTRAAGGRGFDYTPEGEVPIYVAASRAMVAQRLLKKTLWKA